MFKPVPPLVVCLAGLLLSAATAEAQIYTWHDANGALVLSHRPKSVAVSTYSVPNAQAVRTTKPAMVLRASSFDSLIETHATSHQIRPDLVRAVIQVESAFNPKARSPKGAMGLMQLMPATAAELGVRNPYDPDENIKAGVAYLKQLLTRYEQDETLALAAYNAGPGAVDRYGAKVPPYRETRDYVNRIQQATPMAAVTSSPAPAASPAAPKPAAPVQIYRTTETVGDTVVQRYTNVRPRTTEAVALVSQR